MCRRSGSHISGWHCSAGHYEDGNENFECLKTFSTSDRIGCEWRWAAATVLAATCISPNGRCGGAITLITSYWHLLAQFLPAYNLFIL